MPSPQYSKAKGRGAENDVAGYLRERGYELAERRTKAGAKDRGDITGVPGRTIEVKHHAKLAIPEWLRQTYVEREHTGDPDAFLVVRPRGVTDPARFWSVRYLEHEVDRLLELDDLCRTVHGAPYTHVK